MKKILSIVLVTVLLVLASVVTMAVTPAGAYEWKIPCDDGDNELTKDELVNAIFPYMLDEGEYSLDEVGDASYVYAYWDGKPKKIVDQSDREVTLYKPVERVVSPSRDSTRVLVALDACDTFVGVCDFSKYASLFPEIPKACEGRLLELPDVGGFTNLNYELLLSLEPDVIVGGFGGANYIGTAEMIQKRLKIPFVIAYGYGPGDSFDNLFSSIETIGKVIEKETESKELCSLIEEKIDKVREFTSQIPEEDKPKVYFSSRGAGSRLTRTHPLFAPLDIAGGINVAKDVPGASTATEVTVSKEQIVAWNPDIIIVPAKTTWTTSDRTEDILLDPDLQTINAVENHSVYNIIPTYFSGLPPHRSLVNTMYLAKLFHPEKFNHLDVEEEGNEIYTLFYKVGGLFSEFVDISSWSWLREFIDNPPEEREW